MVVVVRVENVLKSREHYPSWKLRPIFTYIDNNILSITILELYVTSFVRLRGPLLTCAWGMRVVTPVGFSKGPEIHVEIGSWGNLWDISGTNR